MTRIVLCLLFFLSSLSLHVLGSSHSEAPGTAKIPSADAVDFYMFRSYEDDREDYTTFILNAYPLQDPFAGPNYFALSDQHFYQFHIDNDGDAVSDIDISFYFGAQLGGEEYQTPFDPEFCDCNSGTVPDETKHHGLTVDILDADGVSINHPQFVPLKFIGPVSGPDDATLNFKETFQIRWTQGGVDTEIENPSGGFSFPKPFDYAGEKTFGDAETYELYARSFIQSFSIPNCAEQGKVFVGQRKEPFHINLGKIFDLVNFIPIQDFIEQSDNNNDLRFISTTSLVIELPTSCVLGASDVIGAWTTVNQLCHAGADHVVGEQFSRLGNPLVNELVIGLEKKKDFNQQPPTDDAASFLDFVQFPSFPAILDLLFRDAVNDAMGTDISNLAPNNLPRNDLVTVFLTGIPGLNMPTDPNFMASEMMRLNTTVPPTKRQNQNHLGLLFSFFFFFFL